jgi:site-specific recombinase XerC
VDLIGKGGHVRAVPMPDWVKREIDKWCKLGGVSTGKIFRCICREGKAWGDGISEQTVWHVVRMYAAQLGLGRIAPHDLRRLCARLCHGSGGELHQIHFLLVCDTWAASNPLEVRSMTGSALNARISLRKDISRRCCRRLYCHKYPQFRKDCHF